MRGVVRLLRQGARQDEREKPARHSCPGSRSAAPPFFAAVAIKTRFLDGVRVNMFKSATILCSVFLMASTVCHAQLGGQAPMPQQTAKPSGPSLEETTRWITEKFGSSPPAFFTGSTGNRNEYRNQVLFDGCYFGIAQRSAELGGSNGADYQYELTSIHLKELDPQLFSVWQESSPNMIRLTLTPAGKRKIMRAMRFRSKTNFDGISINGLLAFNQTAPLPARYELGKKTKIGAQEVKADQFASQYLLIELPDMQLAERMNAAFRHAVSLCQKMATEERAARPAPAKELF